MARRHQQERFYIDSTGTACVSGGAPYDPVAERKFRKDRHTEWLASLTPDLKWVVDQIAKRDKFARGHERTMAMHAFYSKHIDRHAKMPKADVLATICKQNEASFTEFLDEYFKR